MTIKWVAVGRGPGTRLWGVGYSENPAGRNGGPDDRGGGV